MKNGEVGQILPGEDYTILNNQYVKLGIYIDEKELREIGDYSFSINNKTIKMGITGIYELEIPIQITQISIPLPKTDSSIKVNYIIYKESDDQ